MGLIGASGDKIIYMTDPVLATLQAAVKAMYENDPNYQVWGNVTHDGTDYIQAMVRR